MKLSMKWLQDFCHINKATADICNDLTMLGLEVEQCSVALPAELDRVVIATVTSLAAHPTSKTPMQVAQIRILDRQYQIVTAANNIALHQKVPVALAGVLLPNGKLIEERPLVGVLSQGMFCSMVELGLAKESLGIWELPANAPEGATLMEYLENDEILTIALTPNRGDCYSVLGIARELAAKYQLPMHHQIAAVPAINSTTKVAHLSSSQACPLYASRIINNVNASAQTPMWMMERLRRSGIRIISCIVDITNYVMLELGQPLHAFDLSKLDGDIHVRYAKSGEAITLLDTQALLLDPAAVVIADDKQLLALAGIMGGSYCGISQTTTDILLEGAYFEPLAIGKTVRRYKINTEAGARFERGVDPSLTAQAIERATGLIIEIAGGVPGPMHVTTEEGYLPQLRELKQIVLPRRQLQKVLGISIDADKVVEILQGLNINLLAQDVDTWSFSVPSYRFDLNIAEDLCEEIARSYGYANIPARIPVRTLKAVGIDSNLHVRNMICQYLCNGGYHEVITYSFIDQKWYEKYFNPSSILHIMNPIASDMAVMRTSLLPGLLQVAQYNYQHGNKSLRIFELGRIFNAANDAVLEQEMLAGCLMGGRWSNNWADPQQMVDFFDAKGDITMLLQQHKLPLFVVPYELAEVPLYLHPARSAKIRLAAASSDIGFLGEVHPQLLKELGIDVPVVVFTIEFAVLSRLSRPINFKEISKFPTICRDLSIIINEDVPVDHMLAVVANHGGDLLHNTQVFDLYRGTLVPTGQKSVALQLVFQHATRTLRDDEVNMIIDSIMSELADRYQAKLRIEL